MSSISARDLGLDASHRRQAAQIIAVLASPWITVTLLLLAIGQQATGALNGDVSWFITFAEKFLDGAVPYVDVMDPNTPAVFLSLAPAVVLARAIHAPVEAVVVALVFFAAAVSLTLCALIFRAGAPRSRMDRMLLLNAAVYLLLLAPAHNFAEREHIALIALAPMLATLIVAAEGGQAALGLRILAGVGAGAALCFKPFFALALFLPMAALTLRARSMRYFFTAEAATAALLCLVYGVATLRFFPAYLDYAAPLITQLYQPARDTTFNLVLRSLAPFNVALLAALAFAAARGFAPPPVTPRFVAPAGAYVCGFASVAFLFTFFLQGKGWANHAYPGVALALIAWCFFVRDPHPRARAASHGALFKFVFLPVFVAAPALFGAAQMLAREEEQPGLRAAIARFAPPHPRMIALAQQLDLGHPVTRQLGGVWVGRPNALWVANFADHLLRTTQDPSRRVQLEGFLHRDLVGFREDIRNGQPDVVVVEDRALREWALTRPETAGALDDFQLAGQAGAIEIWTRKSR